MVETEIAGLAAVYRYLLALRRARAHKPITPSLNLPVTAGQVDNAVSDVLEPFGDSVPVGQHSHIASNVQTTEPNNSRGFGENHATN